MSLRLDRQWQRVDDFGTQLCGHAAEAAPPEGGAGVAVPPVGDRDAADRPATPDAEQLLVDDPDPMASAMREGEGELDMSPY